MRFKTVILDFDGTIGDSQRLIVTTLKKTISVCGLPKRSDAQCAATIGLPLPKAFVSMFGVSEENGQRYAETYRRIFMQEKKRLRVEPFPKVLDTIHKLHAMGIKLAIASSRSRQSLVEYVEQYGIEVCISCIVAADDVINAKPAPDMVLKVLAVIGSDAAETLTVGDMAYDIQMGHAAGTSACGVTYGNGTLAELSGADFIINDFSELLKLL